MRCLALASAFADGGWRIGFAATEETFSSVAALERSDAERLVLSPQAESEPAEIARRWPDGVDVLFVDHYEREASFERGCRPWARRIVVIDDLADRRHEADVLVDAAAESDASYRGLVPSSCKVLVGPKFAIVHPAFRHARERALVRRDGRPVTRVLVSFGQVDAPNATTHALDALEAAGFSGEVDVVLGRAAPHLAEVQARATDRVRVHVDVGNMPELMTAADLAIGAGGGTAWERCCLGLPSIIVTVADNQRGIVARVFSADAGVDAGAADTRTEDRLAQAVRELIEDGSRRAAVARNGAALVDGRGCDRAQAAAIGTVASRDGGVVAVRPAEPDDEEWLLELQRQPQTRRYANDPKPPMPDDHRRWFVHTLGDAERRLLVAEVNDARVAMLRLDRGTSADRVSVAVHPGSYRRGIGAAVLALAARLSQGRPLEAEILPGNDASLSLFQDAGYCKVGERLFRRMPT
jgi:UDP-2,4-diacetamido-2,4,6-trideoxy-beta-L-altropyranose hydrolase